MTLFKFAQACKSYFPIRLSNQLSMSACNLVCPNEKSSHLFVRPCFDRSFLKLLNTRELRGFRRPFLRILVDLVDVLFELAIAWLVSRSIAESSSMWVKRKFRYRTKGHHLHQDLPPQLKFSHLVLLRRLIQTLRQISRKPLISADLEVLLPYFHLHVHVRWFEAERPIQVISPIIFLF